MHPDVDVDTDVFLAAFEATPGNAAILDADGAIVAVNEGWRRFGAENDLANADASLGTDYVAACREGLGTTHGDDETAREAADGLSALLAGEADRFALEYPCHSPAEKRWFLLRAVAFEHDADRYVQVTHLDITDRVAAEREVRRRASELEDVVSLLAHDVRNPLGVAEGWLGTVDPADDADAEALDTVERSLARIEATVEDALTFLRADADAADRERVAVGGLARTLWADFGGDPDRLVVADDVAVECHPDLFAHLLENLLANAREHGGDDVTVTVAETPDGFSVADDGPGIPPERRDEVFEVGVSDDPHGTGFGLSIVGSVVDRHGWDIAIAESEDGGASFEVRTRPAYASDGVGEGGDGPGSSRPAPDN